MNLNWKDVTSYSQRDNKRIPRTWELDLEELNYKVIVARHIYYENTWLLTCRGANIEQVDLNTDDIDEAKDTAIRIIADYLDKLVERALKQSEIIKGQ